MRETIRSYRPVAAAPDGSNATVLLEQPAARRARGLRGRAVPRQFGLAAGAAGTILQRATMAGRPRLPRTPKKITTTLPAEIFKAYDIRGIVGNTLTAPIVRAIGQALGRWLWSAAATPSWIGRDGRLSGPELCGALAHGMHVQRRQRHRHRHGDDADELFRRASSGRRNAASWSRAATIRPITTASRW